MLRIDDLELASGVDGDAITKEEIDEIILSAQSVKLGDIQQQHSHSVQTDGPPQYGPGVWGK